MLGNMQAIGLMFDAIGILILGVPAIFRVIPEIKAQSGTYFDYNKSLAEALSAARVDLSIGSVALLLGFLFQLADTLGYYAVNWFGALMWALCMLLVPLHFLVIRPRLVVLILDAVMKAHQSKVDASMGAS